MYKKAVHKSRREQPFALLYSNRSRVANANRWAKANKRAAFVLFFLMTLLFKLKLFILVN